MKKILFLILLLGSLMSCTKKLDSPGYEYTPDMYYSPAYDSYDEIEFTKDFNKSKIKESVIYSF